MILLRRNNSNWSLRPLLYCILVVIFKLVYLLDYIHLVVKTTESDRATESEREDDKISRRSLQTGIPIQRYAANGQLPAQTLHFPQTNLPQVPASPWNYQQALVNSPSAAGLTTQTDDFDRFWFLKNFVHNSEQDRQQLAAINNRAPLNQHTPIMNSHQVKPKLNQTSQNGSPDSPFRIRSDSAGSTRRLDEGPALAKRGRLDDNYDENTKHRLGSSATKSAHYFPAQQYPVSAPLFKKPNLLLDKPETNCIKRSESKVAICEDHLIRRLKQDAGEGRTALDVERRVCCALFWHKDCVARMMLETCPDSSPAAADELMGPRKLDLTLSCQKFNRDGCNAANQLLRPNFIIFSLFIIVYLTYVQLYQN